MNGKCRKTGFVIALALIIVISFSGCYMTNEYDKPLSYSKEIISEGKFIDNTLDASNDCTYEETSLNVSPFTEDEITTESFEYYSELDALGRCGVAFACIGIDLMPTTERGAIGGIQPTGWHTVKYDIIADRYLYNRCHLIGYQLSGENANERNLITGTRYLNTEEMLPLENMIADYVKETENHVMYRVTPYFEGDNLVASGVFMEAYSVEDNGDGVCFSVYCQNVQPGIVIDYATGESWIDESWSSTDINDMDLGYDYVLNTNTKRFHDPSCSSVLNMSDKNKDYFTGSREQLIESGYVPCGNCNP